MPSVSSLEEAAELLAAAHAEGGRLRIGDGLTTDGLDRILEHETGDLTCTVEAGIRLSALYAALGRSGQRLSLDPPGDPTIGALLAENLSGPLRHRFGAPRDVVLGVTLVLVWTWDGIAGLPALPAVCLGFLLPNADLLWRNVREARAARAPS